MTRALVATAVILAAARGDADPDPGSRQPDATMGQIFAGPFASSRLFAMPVADVIGAYMMSFSGDGSLLQQPGVLTSAGVIAIGFGDLAQLEYRHTEVVSVTGVDAPVPTVGVELKIPLPARPNVPAFAIAYRHGLDRTEQFGATYVDETVTDLYVVARERFAAAPWLTFHGGLRVSPSHIALSGDRTESADRTLWLPTGGVDIAMNRQARLVGEAALVPAFRWTPGSAAEPAIDHAVLGRVGLRWAVIPSVILDGSIGYQLDETGAPSGSGPRDVVSAWDIRLGAEVFVPWGALACRAAGVFCE
jgi:hypothetical protein